MLLISFTNLNKLPLHLFHCSVSIVSLNIFRKIHVSSKMEISWNFLNSEKTSGKNPENFDFSLINAVKLKIFSSLLN